VAALYSIAPAIGFVTYRKRLRDDDVIFGAWILPLRNQNKPKRADDALGSHVVAGLVLGGIDRGRRREKGNNSVGGRSGEKANAV